MRVLTISLLMVVNGTAVALDNATSYSGAKIVPNLEIALVEDMSFGTIVPATQGDSLITLPSKPDNKISCSSNVNCLHAGKPATLHLNGKAYSQIGISIPQQIIMRHENGEHLSAHNLSVTDENGQPISNGVMFLNQSGKQKMHIGADLTLPKTQAPGHYQGTFTITVNYQ